MHDRDPVGAGHAARPRRRRVPRARRSRCGRCRPCSSCCRRRPAACARCARCRSRTCSAASRCAWSSSASARYLTGRSCWSPARAARSAPSCAARSRASAPRRLVLLDHAEDNLFEIERELEEDRHVARRRRRCSPTARRRSACGRCSPSTGPTSSSTPPPTSTSALMECNPVEAVRNNALATRLWRACAGEAGRRALRAGLDRQGGRARDGHGRLQGAGRVGAWRRPAAASPTTALRHRALRQRARLVGLGGADLPPPDRGRRPGDRHRPAHDALLHDHPGGGAARHPRRLAGHGRRGLTCSRWASRCGSWTWRAT